MTFDEFDAVPETLSHSTLKDHFHPDGIIARARGSWILERLLAKLLKADKMFSCDLTYSDLARTSLIHYQDIPPCSPRQKILVVEDFLESDKSINKVMSHLSAQGIDALSAALGYLAQSIHIPTFSLGCNADIPQYPRD